MTIRDINSCNLYPFATSVTIIFQLNSDFCINLVIEFNTII